MLEAHGIRFGFHGREPLYRDFDLAVGREERVELRAPSGFGKTTLCRILAGCLTPDAGSVSVGGEPLPLRGVCPVQLVGQHPEQVLDPRMRMGESLLEGLPEGEAPDPGLLRDLGIQEEQLRRFPRELSGGQLQRFCLARALGAKPRYLVADEITTMLDAVSQAAIWRVVLGRCECEGMGLVFVTHSPALADRIATRTVMLG